MYQLTNVKNVFKLRIRKIDATKGIKDIWSKLIKIM